MIAPYAEKCKMQEVDLFNFSVFVISLLVILVIGVNKLSYYCFIILCRLLYFLLIPMFSMRGEDMESNQLLYDL